MKNLFSKVVASGAVLLGTSGIAGCGSNGHDRYDFNRKIDGELVEFKQKNLFGERENHMNVTKADGTKVYYRDYDKNDMKIEKVVVVDTLGNETYFLGDIFPKSQNLDSLKAYQAELESYLGKILTAKETLARGGN